MIKQHAFLIASLLAAPVASAAPQQPSSPPPTTAAAEVMQCAQAQLIVDRLLESATTRLETARQTNSAADMRAAIDALHSTLRDVRAQLAPCASLQPAAGPHAGHVMGGQSQPAGATPRLKPSAPAPVPGAAAPAAKPPAAKPPAATDPHAGTPAPSQPTSVAEAIDPVCGLKVDPRSAPRGDSRGKTYYFCSEKHKELFMKDPAKYLPKEKR